MSSNASFLANITIDQLEDDPYPTYRELRQRAPVAYVPAANAFLITRFEHCKLIGLGREGFTGAQDHPTLTRVFGCPNVLSAENEDHKELRAGINPRLRPKPVADVIERVVRPIAKSYIAGLLQSSSAELVEQYFEPVSVDALRHVMGLDDVVSSATLRSWFYDLNLGASNLGLDPTVFKISDAAGEEIERVVRPKLEFLVANPDDSMLSHMLWTGRSPEQGPRSFEFVFPSLKVILLGGMQEPGHAAGSTLLGLFSDVQQWSKLKKDPTKFIPLAVDEGLRWLAPIGVVERQATRDALIGGQVIPSGAIVQVVLGSANRDESRFAEAEEFRMERDQISHQAFGNGPHFCAGHFFARQVEHVMLEELVAALPNLRPDPDRKAKVTGWVFRAPKVLPTVWDTV